MPTVEHRTDTVTPGAARSLHDLLDRDGCRPRQGDPLPILWHWLAFLPQCAQADLGPDGHPSTGRFLPPADGRQRMYAGGKVTCRGNVYIGESVTRRSAVTDVVEKQGATGPLRFVTVEHVTTGRDGLIEEHQHIVYKDPRPFRPPNGYRDQLDDEWAWERPVPISPPLLFRFSALTYNAHRIHYDRDYATQTEGYPGLVVQGPLQAMLLADSAERARPGRRVSSFSFRATAPAFDDTALRLCLRPGIEERSLELGAFSARRRTMGATATMT